MVWKRLTSQNGKPLDSLPNTRFDNNSRFVDGVEATDKPKRKAA